MSRRRFLGWEPVETTSYVYDGAGRLSSSTTVREPEWSDEERGWAQALEMVERRACHGCGRPTSEVWGEDRVAEWEAEHHYCGLCLTVAQHGSAVSDERPQMPSQALRVTARRRAPDNG